VNGSCSVHVTWGMCTGLSEIFNHNERSSPILAAYTYTKLQTRWHIQLCYGCLNLLSHTLLHSHCSNTINISTYVMLVFWLCQFNTGSLPCGLCLSLTTECFVRLFQFNVPIFGNGWWCLSLEFHWVSFISCYER